jgi:hypothetical protein
MIKSGSQIAHRNFGIVFFECFSYSGELVYFRIGQPVRHFTQPVGPDLVYVDPISDFPELQGANK